MNSESLNVLWQYPAFNVKQALLRLAVVSTCDCLGNRAEMLAPWQNKGRKQLSHVIMFTMGKNWQSMDKHLAAHLLQF